MSKTICWSSVLSVLLVAGSVRAELLTVGIYDENAVQTNQVDVDATPLTSAQMAAKVATAFADGNGGVIDFDEGTITDSRTMDAIFAGGTKTLRLTNAARDWQIGNLGIGANAGPISNGSVLFNGAPDPFPNPFLNSVVFGDVTDSGGGVLNERVSAFGLTAIDSTFRGQPNTLNFTVTYSDGSTDQANFLIPVATQTNDTFVGFEAGAGLYIRQVDFTATNNLATDDWAFVTTAVPEPGTPLVLAMIGVLIGCRRRKR